MAWAPWLVLVVLLVLDRIGVAPNEEDDEPRPFERRWVVALAGLSALIASVRAPLALGREVRNVDELMYAATGAFFRDSGQSLFSHPWNFSAQQLVHTLASWEQPFWLVDVATSGVVGLTAFLVGLVTWRLRGDGVASLLAALLYGYGIVRFEGLTSNKEPWVNLFLAGYLLVRNTVPARVWARQLAAGLCLGAAAAVKEQALVFVLVEPLLAFVERLPQGGFPKAWFKDQAFAAIGFWIPVGAVWAGFASQGMLGAYLEFLSEWATSGAEPVGNVARALGVAAPPPAASELSLLPGLSPLLLSPVGFLGLFRLMAYVPRLQRAGDGPTPPSAALVLVASLAILAASSGLRFFLHYFMLPMLALAPLAAVEATRAVREWRRPSALGAVLLAALLGVVEVGRLVLSDAGRSAAQGRTLPAENAERVQRVGAVIRDTTPADAPILVWGSLVELYFAAERRPATRYVGGVTAPIRFAYADLERGPKPSLVVFVHRQGYMGAFDPYALELHPRLAAWLSANGYRQGEPVEGFSLWRR